jgi:hypothetical protein
VTWEHKDVMREEYPHSFEDFEKLVDVVQRVALRTVKK